MKYIVTYIHDDGVGNMEVDIDFFPLTIDEFRKLEDLIAVKIDTNTLAILSFIKLEDKRER